MGFKSYGSRENTDLKYKVLKRFGKLDSDGKYVKELRLISWNEKNPVYDLRGWYKDEKTGEEKMTKGVTMDAEEVQSLYELLKEISEDEDD